MEWSELQTLLTRDLFADTKLERYKSGGINEESITKIYKLKKKCGGTLSEFELEYILRNILSVDDLHAILKLSPQSDTVLEKEFEGIWNGIMDTIDYTPPRTYIEVAKKVEEELSEHVEHIGHRGLLIKKLGQTPFKKWKNNVPKPNTSSLSFQLLVDKELHHAVRGRLESEYEVITNDIVFKAINDLSSITMRNHNFSVALIQEFLKKVDGHITSASSKQNKYLFTTDFKLELYLIVCSKSIEHFENMARKFEHEQDPKKYIEENEKNIFLVSYKNEYKKIEAEESIPYHICIIFESPIKKVIKKNLHKIVDEMRAKETYLKDKGKLKVKILSDLLDRDDFKQTMVYIKDIQTCMAEHIKIYTIKFADEKSPIDNFTRLQAVVKNVLADLIQRINKVIQKIFTESKTLKDVSDKLVNDKRLHAIIEYNNKNIIGTDVHEDVNLANLKNRITIELWKLEVRIQNSFSSLKCEEAMKDWSKQPHEMLRDIIGCTAACPFCGEQCDHLDEDHFKTRKIRHATKIHRFNCLAGWRSTNGQAMVTGFCPQRVASNLSFYKSNGELHPYKKYYEVYGDWSIEKTPTSKNALYWKMFIMKYNKELAETYNAKLAVIPLLWREEEYSNDKVKKDLESLYEQLA